MSFVAIVGAGSVGAAVAHRLAIRARVRRIHLIDTNRELATGKALDIQQAGPIEDFDTELVGGGDVLAAAGAAVIVLADDAADGEWTGDRGMSVLAQLVRAGSTAALVFAGPHQTTLMETCYRQFHVPSARLIGTAPAAMVGAARALANLEMNAAGAQVIVLGRAPEFVIAWSSGSIAGTLLTDRIPAHRLTAIAQSLMKLWPPGPYAIASATAPVVEALLEGGRTPLAATSILDGELGVRGTGVLLPLELGRQRVLSHRLPSLSPQERTSLINSLAQRA